MKSSKSELVFTNPNGKMYREDTKLAKVLRTALESAGIVEGYDHVCRRNGCGYSADHSDSQLRNCPRCGFKLWPKARVRPIRFQDLRATTASFLIENKVPLAVAQRILRHSSPAVTMKYYARFDTDFLKKELEKISFGGSLSALATAPKAVKKSSSFGTGLVHEAKQARLVKRKLSSNSAALRP